jgi:hypothetical protein
MQRVFHRFRIGACVVLASFAATQAAASHPDILRHYRFIPSRSIVERTGGIAGFHIKFKVRGEFDLVTGYEEGVSCAAIGCPPPDHIPFAEFQNVAATLHSNSPFAEDEDLDELLNFSGLEGTFTTPNRLFFAGSDGDGYPFRMRATIIGPLIHLVGENDPPCCDFYQYRINAYAHRAPFADFNFDGSVDAADFTTWRDHMGMAVEATLDEGDADGDGDVDHSDFLVWKSASGSTIDLSAFDDGGDGSAGASPSGSGVPEPATIALMLLVLVSASGTRRRRGLPALRPDVRPMGACGGCRELAVR